MRKILSLLLVLSILLGAALPLSVFAADADSATPTELAETQDEIIPDEQKAPAVDDDNADFVALEPEESYALGTSGQEEAACETAAAGVMPLSGWEDEYAEFYTRIRLTVTDRGDKPVEGAVYGLYRMDSHMLVEELKSDSYGVATSGDVPADTDYYLLEHICPEGFLPNQEHKDIILREVCAPSRIDVTAVYDPVMGRIKVVKDDEYGNPIEGVGFYVYRADGWELADTIYTDHNGEACTTELPYSRFGYELYEFYAPEDFVSGGYYTVYLTEHEQLETVFITNYRAAGSARIHKSGSDGRNVQGAVYSIYRVPQVQPHAAEQADRKGGEWVCDVTTGSGGYAYAYDLPMGDFYAVEKSVPEPYRLDDAPQYFSISYNGQWAYLTFVNEVEGESGRLRLLKTDDAPDPNPLPGVVFGLYRAWDNKKLAELTTSPEGAAEYGPLISQDYYLLELSGKDGYQMAVERIPFTVGGSGGTVELTVVNPKIRVFGKVKAVKTDDAGSPVPGVRIGVYCKWGNLLEELVTGEDGTAVSGILNEGSGYYLLELEGVPGHLSGSEQHPFDITENGAVVSVEIVNPRIRGGIQVLKSSDGGEPLPGVIFGIYQNGSLIEKLTTLEDGTAASGTLYYGDYELIELSGAEGYERIDTPIPFSITEDGVILEIPVANPLIMGTITVIKEKDKDGIDDDNDSKNASQSGHSPLGLPGAVFGLYNGQGQKLAELVTGEDGAASYSLPKGSFYLKELAAPEGFALTDELIPFSIEAQGQVVEKVVVNAQGHGAVTVIKSSDDGEDSAPLPGVAFDVFREADDEKVGEIVTLEDGTATLELPLGRYYLVETSTVEGFQLLPGQVSFALTVDGATLELPIANQRTPAPEDGGIRLVKKSAGDGALLPGAGFGVYAAATDEKAGELTTGPDGSAGISLPAGDYYLLEQISPEGFRLREDKIPVTVTVGVYTEVTVENEPDEAAPGELRVIKHAAGTGERLPDAKFGVYAEGSDGKVGEITTSENGVAGLTLPEGDYYLLELSAPKGFRRSGKPVTFQIVAGETCKLTIANEPETPAEDTGTVRFVKEDEDGKKLSGAVIGVYRRADSVKSGADEKVAELTTGKDGAVEYDLAAGDFYWKELRAPEGFAPLTGKHTFTIAANKTKEITVVNEALPDDTGRLLLLKRAAGSGDGVADAVFGVYLAGNNRKAAEITTDDDGEAEIALEPNRYYLKELSVPSPFVLESTKIPFAIQDAGDTVTVEVSNTKGVGTLLLEKSSAEGGPVAGSVFILCKRDGTRIAELTSGKDGTAAYELPVGAYYIEEKTAAAGFRLDATRHGFTIKNKETTTVKVTNEPLTGTVEVYFKHTADSRELAETQVLTDAVGTDYIKWMREKKLENRLLDGYTLLRTEYPSSLVLIDGTLAVTLWYDDPTAPAAEKPGGGIDIPKTGEPFPYDTYALSLLCWMAAAFCAVMLYRRRRLLLRAAGASIAIPPVESVGKVATQAGCEKAMSKKKRKKRGKGRRQPGDF